jgi:hypothetical protein
MLPSGYLARQCRLADLTRARNKYHPRVGKRFEQQRAYVARMDGRHGQVSGERPSWTA